LFNLDINEANSCNLYSHFQYYLVIWLIVFIFILNVCFI